MIQAGWLLNATPWHGETVCDKLLGRSLAAGRPGLLAPGIQI